MYGTIFADPPIVTPVTRRLATFDNLQWHHTCSGFEIRAVECFESYGATSPKCKDYIDDLRECLYGFRKEARTRAMMKERHTRYNEGSKKELYAPAPVDDSY